MRTPLLQFLSNALAEAANTGSLPDTDRQTLPATDRPFTRRAFVGAAGVTAGAVVAGCRDALPTGVADTPRTSMTSGGDRRVHVYHADGHECAACHGEYADGHRVAAGRVTGRGHVTPCDTCGVEHDVYHSCRNRRGPSCHGVSTRAWLAARETALLPVPYFPVVFTLPAELRAIVRSHQRVLLGALMQTAAESWQALAAGPPSLGGTVGILAVRHTWTRTLGYHPPVHGVVPGGALAPDGVTWRRARGNYLVPVRALSVGFRARLLARWRLGPARCCRAARRVEETMGGVCQAHRAGGRRGVALSRALRASRRDHRCAHRAGRCGDGDVPLSGCHGARMAHDDAPGRGVSASVPAARAAAWFSHSAVRRLLAPSHRRDAGVPATAAGARAPRRSAPTGTGSVGTGSVGTGSVGTGSVGCPARTGVRPLRARIRLPHATARPHARRHGESATAMTTTITRAVAYRPAVDVATLPPRAPLARMRRRVVRACRVTRRRSVARARRDTMRRSTRTSTPHARRRIRPPRPMAASLRGQHTP